MKIDPDDYAYPLQAFERSDGQYLTAVPGMSVRAVIAKDLLEGLCASMTEGRMKELCDGIGGGKHEVKIAIMLTDLLIAELNKGTST